MADDSYTFPIEGDVVIEAPVKVDFNFKELLDDLKESLNKLVNDIRHGDDEVLTTIMFSGLVAFTVIYMWRRV